MYKIREVAELLRLDYETVRRHIAEGKLKAMRIGRQYRIDKAELERYMADARDRG